MANQERRRQTRYKIDKPVTIRDGADQHTGRLSDISSGGAAVSAIDDDTVFDEDQALELELDDVGRLPGNVVRTLDDGFAMAFDLDEEGEEQLITEITGIRSGMEFE
ncbi:MAG: PilZ domain-containing protein [Rhodospirillaceae bacterium]|nr:PilZ domain-containing protein [Rhodospirillaceae bacterium]